jgi:hypothetical protein
LDLKREDLLKELEDTTRRLLQLANPLTAEVIQIEHHHRGAANRSPSFHFTAFESEVFRPQLLDGMKQGHQLACQRINSCCPVGFMQVASGGTLRRGLLEWTRRPSIAG